MCDTKRRITFTGLHGLMFRKIGFFITSAVRASNPIHSQLYVARYGSVTSREDSIGSCGEYFDPGRVTKTKN
jgi:hypothetical protein